MEETMKKYAERINRNEVNPHRIDDGHTSGLLLDPARDDVPLEVLGFGIYRLTSDFVVQKTEDREMVLVPQEGEFELALGSRTFTGDRKGGPFAAGPGKSNASAVYLPAGTTMKIRGRGSLAFFTAPAFQEKPPAHVTSGRVEAVSRGGWIWRRDVVSLVSPQDASSNLVVGETYSPPGFWSGTPLHRHDRDDPAQGESDHEEIYYHRFRWPQAGDGFGGYGAQLLMDGQRLMKAFVIGDGSMIAIPGGCHPVVASPVSELLYLWGLAGRKEGGLAMRDIPEFAHLKAFEGVFQELDKLPREAITRERIRELSRPFTGEQARLLAVMIREKGYDPQ